MSDYVDLTLSIPLDQYEELAALGIVQAAPFREEPFEPRHVAPGALSAGLRDLLSLYGLPRASEAPDA